MNPEFRSEKESPPSLGDLSFSAYSPEEESQAGKVGLFMITVDSPEGSRKVVEDWMVASVIENEGDYIYTVKNGDRTMQIAERNGKFFDPITAQEIRNIKAYIAKEDKVSETQEKE